jgi:prepilin signal peptidase PulO-like enzyme (type II secretory pathway)
MPDVIGNFILAGLIGLVLGSFASAVSWRAPRGISWIAFRGKTGRSVCPSCDHCLSCRDLIPLLSWLMLKGRCRYCGAGIGIRYPLIELSTMLGCLAAYAVYGFTAAGFVMIAAMPVLAALAAIDFEHMILPDWLNAMLAMLGLAFIAATGAGDMPEAMIAACVYAALAWGLGWGMRQLLKKDALGMGDVKFFAVAGLWLGLSALPLFLIFSGLAGIVVGLFWKILRREALFPFGPALILSLLTCRLLLPQIQSFGLIPGGVVY